MVSIDNASAKLIVTHRPAANPPFVQGVNMRFACTGFTASGEVTLRGAAGDSGVGWRAGFIQAQWIETNWVYYRGQQNNHGSLFLQRARPPSRPAQACRDCLNDAPLNENFYGKQASVFQIEAPALGPFPVTLRPIHRDFPVETVALARLNTKTGQPNFLREAQFEFFFCTILTVRDPTNNFHFLKSIYWNVRWQGVFLPNDFTNIGAGFSIRATPGGQGAGVGGVINGGVGDRRFTGVLTSAQARSCNQVAARAENNPIVREATVWENFDVRR